MYFSVCMSVLHACMYVCTMFMLGTHESQKKALDSLGLELQLVVSYYVSAGNEPRSFRRVTSAFSY